MEILCLLNLLYHSFGKRQDIFTHPAKECIMWLNQNERMDEKMMIDMIQQQAQTAVCELLAAAKLRSGDLFVVGCSSSEVGGEKIGSHSSTEIADALYASIWPILKQNGIYLAAQCCDAFESAR